MPFRSSLCDFDLQDPIVCAERDIEESNTFDSPCLHAPPCASGRLGNHVAHVRGIVGSQAVMPPTVADEAGRGEQDSQQHDSQHN